MLFKRLIGSFLRWVTFVLLLHDYLIFLFGFWLHIKALNASRLKCIANTFLFLSQLSPRISRELLLSITQNQALSKAALSLKAAACRTISFYFLMGEGGLTQAGLVSNSLYGQRP